MQHTTFKSTYKVWETFFTSEVQFALPIGLPLLEVPGVGGAHLIIPLVGAMAVELLLVELPLVAFAVLELDLCLQEVPV